MQILEQSLAIAETILPKIYPTRKKNKIFHFAFGYKKNKLLAIGQNDPEQPSVKALRLSKKFHTNLKYPYLHAEADLISRLWGKHYIDSKLKVVVVRLNRHGELRQSKPCKRCDKILKALDVNKIWWSTENGFSQ
jgi:hypothetical protein